MKSNKFSKWSPSWEGPYRVVKVIFENTYRMETLQGDRLPRAINGKYLKKYYPACGKMHEEKMTDFMKIVLSSIF